MADLWEPVGGVFWRSAPLIPDFGWSFDKIALIINILGALAIAYFSLSAAARIAERNKIREQLTKEIRDVNAAIALALGVLNACIVYKKLHAKPLADDYAREKQEILNALQRSKEDGGIASATMTLNKHSKISMPIDYLQVVLGHLSATGRLIAVAQKLQEAVTNLNNEIANRNELLRKFSYNELPEGATTVDYFCGQTFGDGRNNKEYEDSVSGIVNYTDDTIFFSYILCADLQRHVLNLQAEFLTKTNHDAPVVNFTDLSESNLKKWVPDLTEYEAWMSGFKQCSPSADPPSSSSWLRRLARLWRRITT